MVRSNSIRQGCQLSRTLLRNVSRRIAVAEAAFGRLYQSVWSQKKINMRLKVCLYRALVLPIAIYASDSWTLKTEDYRQLEAFEMRCLRAIRSVSLRDRLRSTEIREDLGMHETINDVIKKRQIKWFGHIARKPRESLVAQVLASDFSNPRSPTRWADQVKEDTGMPLKQHFAGPEIAKGRQRCCPRSLRRMGSI